MSSLEQPFVIEMLGHVVPDVIRQYDAAPLALEFLGVFTDVPDCSSHACATAASAEEAFVLQQSAGPNVSFLVVSLHPLVGRVAVADCRDEVLPDAFHVLTLDLSRVELLGQGQNAALGVHSDNAACRHFLPNFPSDACHSAAGACSDEQLVTVSIQLRDDFCTRAVLMGQRVRGVVLLVRKNALGVFFNPLDGLLHVVLGVALPVLDFSADNFTAQSEENVVFLLAHFVRHLDDRLKAPGCTHHSQADSSVAAGCFDQSCFAFHFAAVDLVVDNAHTDTILHTAPWVQEFALSDQFHI
mmetsp:Transcript_30109/g.65836  ORF Transcript_30109/g.65836 Transcript_30109/m.65836 type:complete len:299 (+) Transcript_30109:83-979(+)|eukprot:CAMPEP_0116937484 /NCGR_PEP_ID=MMETSP0467-20121206/31536_1 /TAXON_ID=283647 /ORGANISM="Mesodinium pulex, Strain SPMC105" /LENGTH=298 /DNA_ID=CAMNT_0004619317 /DNA_START=85 /DNA_END=981 /DNA_ORIENTATION=-